MQGPADGVIPEPGSVTAVIVTFNSEAVIADCLDSLPTAMDGVDAYEIVVVDNDSTDNTLAMVGNVAPDAKIVRLPSNLGYAAGVNAGIEASSGSDAVLILNPDVRLRPQSVLALLRALAEPGVGIAVPTIKSGTGVIEFSLRREPTVLRALGEAVLGGRRAGRFDCLGEVISDPNLYATATKADWATGAVMLLSRSCLATTGSWDESFFLYSEETDYALRARDCGYSLSYTPEAVAIHLGGESGIRPELWSILVRNRVELYRRRHGKPATAVFRSCVLLNEALRLRRSSVHRAGFRSLLASTGDRREARAHR